MYQKFSIRKKYRKFTTKKENLSKIHDKKKFYRKFMIKGKFIENLP